MDLHKLRIFTAIVRTGSFSRGAESVFVTQPTASQQIAQLETSLGVKLLERGARRISLTPAGTALLPYAEQILSLVETAAESARAAAGIADRTLRLGVGHTLATYLLPDVLRAYLAKYPARRFKIAVGNTAELLDKLAGDEIELALVGSPAARVGISVHPFMDDRIVAIFPVGSTYSKASILPEELIGRTLLVREPGSALHATVQQILGNAALEGDKVIQLAETEAIKRSVAAGLGVALIQEIAVQEEVRESKLIALRLESAGDTRQYVYAHREGETLSGAANDMIKLLTRLFIRP